MNNWCVYLRHHCTLPIVLAGGLPELFRLLQRAVKISNRKGPRKELGLTICPCPCSGSGFGSRSSAWTCKQLSVSSAAALDDAHRGEGLPWIPCLFTQAGLLLVQLFLDNHPDERAHIDRVLGPNDGAVIVSTPQEARAHDAHPTPDPKPEPRPGPSPSRRVTPSR